VEGWVFFPGPFPSARTRTGSLSSRRIAGYLRSLRVVLLRVLLVIFGRLSCRSFSCPLCFRRCCLFPFPAREEDSLGALQRTRRLRTRQLASQPSYSFPSTRLPVRRFDASPPPRFSFSGKHRGTSSHQPRTIFSFTFLATRSPLWFLLNRSLEPLIARESFLMRSFSLSPPPPPPADAGLSRLIIEVCCCKKADSMVGACSCYSVFVAPFPGSDLLLLPLRSA